MRQSGFSGSNDEPEKPDGGDPRRYSPAYSRNIDPICEALGLLLSGGRVLEIGSGSGQHIAEYRRRFPAIEWIASEPDPVFRRSCDAWAGDEASVTLNLDAAADWAPDVAEIAPFSAILSVNVIHIAALDVLHGIFSGAEQVLAPSGQVIFYGPFIETGRPTAESNLAFDERLKGENPAWGLRCADQLAPANFRMVRRIEMPSNNLMLAFARRL